MGAPELRPVDINDLALNTTLYYAADLSYAALDIGLSSALFGALPSGPKGSSNLRLTRFGQAF